MKLHTPGTKRYKEPLLSAEPFSSEVDEDELPSLSAPLALASALALLLALVRLFLIEELLILRELLIEKIVAVLLSYCTASSGAAT